MNKKHIRFPASALAVLFALVAPVQAQSPRQALKAMDVNGDNKLQFEEIQEHRAMRFGQADTNGDGVLDSGEVESFRAQAPLNRPGRGPDAHPGADPIAALDADGDGVLSREEVAVVPEPLRAADADGDGALSRSELRGMRR